MNTEIEENIRKNVPWSLLPAHIKQILNNSVKDYERYVVSFSIKNQLRYRGNLVRQIVRDEKRYYERIVGYSKERLMLFPYHLADMIVKGLRITPFNYYISVVEKLMQAERSYDTLLNFTAADCLRLLGIGRNEYIELMNKSRSNRGRLFGKKNVRGLLPKVPCDIHIEPWWRVEVGLVLEDDIKLVNEEELAVIDKLIDQGSQTAGELNYHIVTSLYKKGLIYLDVPITAVDCIQVPPLQGFVMNRVLGDYFETLLYKIFVSIDEHTTVGELAGVLQVDTELVKQAVSLYCRLQFARKLDPETEKDRERRHESWRAAPPQDLRQSIHALDQLSSTDVKNYWTRKVYFQKYGQVPLCQYKCTMTQELSSLGGEESKWVVDFLANQLPMSNLGKQIEGRGNCLSTDEVNTEVQSDEYKSVINHCKHSRLIEMLDIITPEKKCCQELINSLKCDALEVTVKTKNSEEIWMKERQFRITASRCYNIYTYSGSDWSKKALTYFWPKSFTNKYVKHGRKYEDVARDTYIQSNNVTAVQPGLVICEKQPWLACTPDGVIINDDGSPQVLLEIKCPYSGTTHAAQDFIENCSYLIVENNRLTLKRKHIYYNQVQLSLAILDLHLCHFILYSSSSGTYIQVNIERDDKYCINLLQRLQHNYFHCMIHNVCEELNKNI